MQVFLPYPDFRSSVECLDSKRLGNQIYRECKTLILGGWKYHPASKMWRGYEPALALYALFGLQELSQRGMDYPHHVSFFKDFIKKTIKFPEWLGDTRIHDSHKASLLRKNPSWYGKFGWDVNRNLKYHWPI